MVDRFQKILKQINAEARTDVEKSELSRLRAHFRFGRVLAARRLELGLSQQALARATALQQAEISRLESGGGNPTLDTLNAVAAGLKGRLEFRPQRSAPKRSRR